jgi:hypothetical protein
MKYSSISVLFFLITLKFARVASIGFQPVVVDGVVGVLYKDLVTAGK